jgi:FKBP-type peptidyl-prolyl cis-trans isomerase 2
VKTRIAAVALAATASLALAACAPSDADPAASPSAGSLEADIELLKTFEWSDVDGSPVLTFDTPATVTSSAALVVEDGDGAEITDGMLLTLDYVVFQGKDGEQVFSTYESGQGETVTFGPTSTDPVLYDALTGKHVGADVIYGIQDVQAGDGSSIFLAMTVTSGTEVLERAEGTEVAPVEGLPTVTLDATGKPSVSFEGAVKPAELVAQPLIEGDGDVVEVGDSITIHYTGWIWEGEQFDSSWDAGSPATFTLAEGSLISGWVQGLAGQTVGSQVLLVIPPELGYGEAGSGPIPGGSTLVFVVDILATS